MTATAHTRVSAHVDATPSPGLHAPTSEPVEDPELDALVARYGHRVRYFAYRIEKRYGLSAQCRDDLISSGNWGLFKALKNRRPDAHEHELSAYISKRVEGAVLDEARRILSRLSNHADCDPADFESSLPDDAIGFDWEFGRAQPGPEEMADQEGRWRTIGRAIDHLCDDHQRLLLAYASGHSIAEIARGDGSSPARLQNKMSKISRALRARSPELRRLLRHEL